MVGRGLLRLLRGGDPRRGRALRGRHVEALGRAGRAGAVPLPPRHRRRARLRPVPQPDGSAAPVHARLRRDRREPRAPLPRDRLVATAGADRGVHVLPALPGLQGRSPQARGARRHRRRQVDQRVHAAVGGGGASLRRRARAHTDRGAHRAADREGDPRAADLPRRRRRRLPDARPRGGDALGRRGPASAARNADRLPARRRPVHPRRAVDRSPPARQRPADLARSSGSAISATPSSSSSTTRR